MRTARGARICKRDAPPAFAPVMLLAFLVIVVGRQRMLEANTFCERVINLLREHSSHLSIQGSMENLEGSTRGSASEELVHVLFRWVVHRLMKELHVFCEDLMHVHQ